MVGWLRSTKKENGTKGGPSWKSQRSWPMAPPTSSVRSLGPTAVIISLWSRWSTSLARSSFSRSRIILVWPRSSTQSPSVELRKTFVETYRLSAIYGSHNSSTAFATHFRMQTQPFSTITSISMCSTTRIGFSAMLTMGDSPPRSCPCSMLRS